MRAWVLVTACCLAWLGGAERARAAPRDRGTHFVAELDGGALLSGDAGPALRAALGVGAKWKGFPLRFYLIGQLGVSSYTADAPPLLAAPASSEQGTFVDLALGPRVVVPIYGPVLAYVEAVGGTSLASASHIEPGRARLQAREWLGLFQLAAGVHWRVLYSLSLGVRFSVAWNESGLPGVARYAGVHDAARLSIGGGVTWHF